MDSTQRTRPRGGGSPVGLVIFIIATVVLAATTFWGFQKYKESELNASTAIKNQDKAEKDKDKADKALAALQAAAGAQTPEVLQGFVEDALSKTQELGFGSEAQETATDAMQISVKALEAERDAIEKLTTDNAGLVASVKALGGEKDAAETAYKEEIDNLQAEIDGLSKQMADAKADLKAQIQKEIDDRGRLQNEYFIAQDTYRDHKLTYMLHIAELQQRVRELSGEGAIFEKPDGMITKVDFLNRKATLDIGTSNGIKPGMRFVVFTRDASGGIVQKGVVEVLDAKTKVAIAQILSVRDDQAIGRGDLVYNLAGPQKRVFVFAGKPQEYTPDEWRNFIRANGGDVALEVQKGDQVADYLIICKFDEADQQAGDLVRAARDFGLTIISEKELEEAMGLI